MERLANIVIVGRPNVGKSSFFNRVLGRRAAVVADREGVTRDRHYQVAEWSGTYFQIVDTGGFLARDLDTLSGQVRSQIDAALDDADLALFLVDGKSGVTELDQSFARLVQRRNMPVLLVVNKTESPLVASESHAFWSLGLGQPYPVSALHGHGVAEVLDEVLRRLPEGPFEAPVRDGIRVAILGRPNAGKSTMVNSLVGEERVIISEIAGTTRDAIDTEFEYEGRRIILTDTAGLRKKAKVKDEVEYFSNMRAIEAIRRSDVCIVLVDTLRGIETQDLRICTYIQDEGKGLIFCLNKWDTVDAGDKTFDHKVRDLVQRVPELEWVPIIPTSGLTGRRLVKVLDTVLQVKANLDRILGREAVIEFFEKTVSEHPHPASSQGPVHLTRCCQVMVRPPALAFETKRPEGVQESYVRYLRRRAQEAFGLDGVPLRIFFRSRFRLRTDEELEEYLRFTQAGEMSRAAFEREEDDEAGDAG